MKEPSAATHVGVELHFFIYFFAFGVNAVAAMWTCFTCPPLKMVMSSLGWPCHGPGGVLSFRGVTFKMPFTETQMIGCGFLHLKWGVKKTKQKLLGPKAQ